MNPKPLFILLGAQRRVGKDTAAKIIHAHLSESGRNLYPRIGSFASSLRTELRYALHSAGFGEAANLVSTEDPDLKEKVIRPLLIAYGQARRYFNPTYWIDQFYSISMRISQDTPNHVRDVWIVSDWRFPNEYHRLVELAGGENVRSIVILRPGTPFAGPEEAENAPLCSSIAGQLTFNDGSLEKFEQAIKQQFDHIRHPQE